MYFRKVFMKWFRVILLPALFLASVLVSCRKDPGYVRFRGYAQGGVYSVTVNLSGTSKTVPEVRAAIDSILTLVDTTLSGYNKGSILSRFNAGELVVPNRLFLDTYELAYGWFVRSGGALDFAAGALFDAWGFGFREGRLPSDAEVERLLSISGMGRLKERIPVREDGTVSAADLVREEYVSGGAVADGWAVALNYNAIAQGLTADLVADYLEGIGAKDMLVDIGEIRLSGKNPSGKAWAVGVDRPEDGNQDPGKDLEAVWESPGGSLGVVTSGNYRKFYVVDGVKYAHTIDPRTGRPVAHNLLSATVVSPEGSSSADALATWCMVVGPSAAVALIESLPGTEAFLISSGTSSFGSSSFGTPSGATSSGTTSFGSPSGAISSGTSSFGTSSGAISSSGMAYFEWASPGFTLRN